MDYNNDTQTSHQANWTLPSAWNNWN